MKSVPSLKTPKDILECLEVVPLPPGDDVWKWYMDKFLKEVVELDLEFLFSHAGDGIYCKVITSFEALVQFRIMKTLENWIFTMVLPH